MSILSFESLRKQVISEEDYGNYFAVIPQVEGTAYIAGIVIDPNDPMKDGFILS